MLKKLAHNSTLHSTLPAGFSVNKDLKPLQDLISLEKNVLTSSKRLSMDIHRAAEALKIWGLGEGEDLGDILTASCSLLQMFALALERYSEQEDAIREQMKAVRSREEALDEAKRRRKAVVAKADAQEKKLNKMSPEHKNLSIQTDILNRLREEMAQMGTQILMEETAIGDFKRESTRKWMLLKFGALQECTERGSIVSEYGKLIVDNISQEKTQPGLPRALYSGHGRTQSLLQEGTAVINDILMTTAPGSEQRPQFMPRASHDTSPPNSARNPDFAQPWPQQEMPLQTTHPFDASQSRTSDFPDNPQGEPDLVPPPFPDARSTSTRSMDDFGLQQPAQGSYDGGGRFATFPVKTSNGPNGPRGISLPNEPPSLSSTQEPDDSFSSSVAAALRASGEYGKNEQVQYMPPPGPPPGAAPSMTPGQPMNERPVSPEEEGLAYMSDPSDSYPDQSAGRHVRFEPTPTADSFKLPSPVREDPPTSIPGPVEAGHPASLLSSKRIPPPTFDVDREEEARSRDAAVAEEIRREMDALGSFSPPTIHQSPAPPHSVPEVGSSTQGDLVPPSAPFPQPPISPRPDYGLSHPIGGLGGYDSPSSAVAMPSHSPSSSPPHHSSGLSVDRYEIRPPSSSSAGEYPRNMYANKSATSLSHTAPIGSSTGKISAAAFRRPQNRMGSKGDTSPLSVKKKLPSSPYPENKSGLTPEDSGTPLAPSSPARESRNVDDDFDYIGAYVNDTDEIPPTTSSPPYADYGRLGKVVVTNGPAASPSNSGFMDHDSAHLR